MMARNRRAWNVLFALTTFVSALPLFSTRYLPFTDLPEHLAATATISRLLFGVAPGYELALGTSQYLLYDLVGAVLTRVVDDAILASQLLLAAVAMGWAWSFRAVVRAFGRDERLALFAPLAFWNRALSLGFLPFIGGVPLALSGLAFVKYQLDRPTRGRTAVILVLSVALFYTHVSTWTLFVATAGAVTAATTLPRVDWRRVAATLLPLAPSSACAALWWRRGSLAGRTGQESVVRWPIEETLGAVPIWTFDVWKTHVDELCAVGWWLAFAFLVVRTSPSAGRTRREVIVVITPFVCTALLYLATPFGVGPTAYLSVRLAPLLVLLAVLMLRPGYDRGSALALAIPALMAVLGAGNAVYEMRRGAREHLGDIDALLARIEPGKSLAMLNFESRTQRLHYFPYVYIGSYHRARTEAFVSYSFTRMAHWPVHYAPHARPPGLFETFSPCLYRYRKDGSYYDYVLVQGAMNPFPGDQPGPAFVPEVTSGRFTLYRKAGPEALPDEPERGLCASSSRSLP